MSRENNSTIDANDDTAVSPVDSRRREDNVLAFNCQPTVDRRESDGDCGKWAPDEHANWCRREIAGRKVNSIDRDVMGRP